jgi:aerobic carbon-monoxide dehydrogenase medium subunit
MYASPVDHVVATSWADAVRLLQEGGDGAKILAGGQSLIPMMNLRLATPSLLVDVSGADRPGIVVEDDRLVLSALTRHADLERSPEVAARCPILADAARLIGNTRVRHRGTIGGSCAHADPAAELPCVAVALGATIRTTGPGGERRIAANGFFDSYFTTALGEAEVVSGVEVPAIGARTGWAFLELVRRAGDFAIVAVAALIGLDDAGRCTSARLVACGVGERPVELVASQDILLGEPPDARAAAEAGRLAAAAVDPSDSVHASAGHRREMLEVFVRRAILTAAARADV